MKKITAVASAAAALGLVLSGCAPTTEQASTETTAAPPTVWAGAEMGGTTLNQYIVDGKIAEVPFKKEEPGTPAVDFPLPPDWSPAGEKTPEWAYGAIVYDKPKDPADPPFMIAIASKLTGNVDPQKILEYAPGQLNDLPEFKEIHPPEKDSLSGFQAIDYAGTYTWEGKPRVIGQQTIVIPGKDAYFVLQLNADAPQGEEQVVIDGAKVISEQTKITAPA